MHRLLVCVCTVWLGVGMTLAHEPQEPRARVDIGGGVTFVKTDYDPLTQFNQGLGITLGVLFKNHAFLRFDLSRMDTSEFITTDIGFGLELTIEEDTYIRADATVGYLWNHGGTVRPFVRGGVAFIGLDSDLSAASIGTLTVVSDSDSVFTYGGGVEIGDGPHIFAFDYQMSKDVEVSFSPFGIFVADRKFDFNELRLDYRYRF